MSTTYPTPINAAGSLLPTLPDRIDSWWFCAKVRDEHEVFWVKVHAMAVQGAWRSLIAVRREETGQTSERRVMEPAEAVRVAADSLSIETSFLTVSGDLDGLEISGATDDASVRLTLRRTEPVLFNGGGGLFPFFGGTTGQYALPGLVTSGTLSVGGVTRQVSGRTWFDRQWIAGIAADLHFVWLGLDLGAGRYLSVWDTAGDGSSWVTALQADGSHLIASVRRADRDGQWTLTVPALDASLEITHQQLCADEGSYTGVCLVTGTVGGEEINGHGYTDVIG